MPFSHSLVQREMEVKKLSAHNNLFELKYGLLA